MNEIEEAKECIENGGVIIYPTETAYGIGCDALNPETVRKVYEAKKRPKSKGLTVICSSIEQVEKFAVLKDEERKLVEEFMPGPLTIVAEKKDSVPDELNEGFVFRISSSKTARELAENQPIVATSANISGDSTSYSISQISDDLLEEVDFVLDQGELDDGPTSTIVEVVDGELVIHREGPITLSELENSLSDGSRN